MTTGNRHLEDPARDRTGSGDESQLDALERFKNAPAEMSPEELEKLFTWLAEDPERLHIGDHCDPVVAASQVRLLASLVGAAAHPEPHPHAHREAA